MPLMRGWTVARVRGVPLRLHFSLLLLLAYVMLIASLQLPLVAREAGINPADISGEPWVWGLLFGISLFASVTVHEFGHTFVAMAMGIRVRSVTLMMLGGYSDMEKMPERPYQEFKLAVIGPVVSLAIGGICLLARKYVNSVDLSFFLYWIGSANLVLGIFNLLPAFPLDGGRALRSVLAAKQGQLRGTFNAVRVGKTMAWLLGFVGFMQLNILLVAIAFFIYVAADREWMALMGRELLNGMHVSEVTRKTTPVDENESLQTVAERMLQSAIPVLPVAGTTPAAVIDLEAISRFTPEQRENLRVHDVMRPVSRSLSSEEELSPTLPELSTSPSQALPVTDHDGKIAGVVRLSDVREAMQLRSLNVRPMDDKKKAS